MRSVRSNVTFFIAVALSLALLFPTESFAGGGNYTRPGSDSYDHITEQERDSYKTAAESKVQDDPSKGATVAKLPDNTLNDGVSNTTFSSFFYLPVTHFVLGGTNTNDIFSAAGDKSQNWIKLTNQYQQLESRSSKEVSAIVTKIRQATAGAANAVAKAQKSIGDVITKLPFILLCMVFMFQILIYVIALLTHQREAMQVSIMGELARFITFMFLLVFYKAWTRELIFFTNMFIDAICPLEQQKAITSTITNYTSSGLSASGMSIPDFFAYIFRFLGYLSIKILIITRDLFLATTIVIGPFAISLGFLRTYNGSESFFDYLTGWFSGFVKMLLWGFYGTIVLYCMAIVCMISGVGSVSGVAVAIFGLASMKMAQSVPRIADDMSSLAVTAGVGTSVGGMLMGSAAMGAMGTMGSIPSVGSSIIGAVAEKMRNNMPMSGASVLASSSEGIANIAKSVFTGGGQGISEMNAGAGGMANAMGSMFNASANAGSGAGPEEVLPQTQNIAGIPNGSNPSSISSAGGASPMVAGFKKLADTMELFASNSNSDMDPNSRDLGDAVGNFAKALRELSGKANFNFADSSRGEPGEINSMSDFLVKALAGTAGVGMAPMMLGGMGQAKLMASLANLSSIAQRNPKIVGNDKKALKTLEQIASEYHASTSGRNVSGIASSSSEAGTTEIDDGSEASSNKKGDEASQDKNISDESRILASQGTEESDSIIDSMFDASENMLRSYGASQEEIEAKRQRMFASVGHALGTAWKNSAKQVGKEVERIAKEQESNVPRA